MLARLRRNLTFANVCSFLALFVALSTGAAYAANTVFSTDIVDGQVFTSDLADATPPGELGPQGITTEKIEDGAIIAAKIATGAVGSSQIADDAVTGAKVADGAVTGADVAADAITGAKVADGAINNADVAGDAIDGSKVANDSLTLADLRGADVNGTEINVKKGGAPTGGCKDFDVPATGASPGETVMITPQAGLPAATVLYGVRVVAADHVTIKVCYLKKHGKMPAITGLPVRIVTFG